MNRIKLAKIIQVEYPTSASWYQDNFYEFISKSKNEFKEQLHLIYDNSIEIAEFISNYAFKIIVPNTKGRKMSKKLAKENKKK